LLWLLRQNDIDEQRSTLIADVLWLEQSVRFHLEGNSEQLRQLVLDLTRAKDRDALFILRARHILKNNSELLQLLWLDTAAAAVHGMPTRKLATTRQRTLRARTRSTAPSNSPSLASQATAMPTGSMTQRSSKSTCPSSTKASTAGTLLAVYSLDGLLTQHVPWWFAKKYQVRIIDGNGKTLASKSNIDAAPTTISYPVIFDPPGYGMVLQVTAYRGADNLAQTLIAALIVILAAAVFWSLWAVRGLIQRRLYAEQALRSEYAFRKAMEDSLMVGMRARDMEGRVSYVNPAFLQMVGFSADELIGLAPPMPYWAPEEMERTLQLHNEVLEGKAPHEGFEIRLMRKNGSRFDALVYEAPLIDADGQQTGWMASIIDVTARKHAEELAQQQQEKLQVTARLVTMGEMASTLAHELNQPLAAITSYNTGCLNKLESGNFSTDELKEALGKLAVQAQRAGHIIRRVHDFVRKSEPKRVPCDLAEVIDDSVGFIDGAAKARGVRIVREIQGMRPELLADPVMLEQVLLNLMRNGIEAMRHTPSERRRLTVKLSQLDRQQMEIRVIDHGPGIPPEVEDKLFTPLFSTKAEGMGMGLNICRSIIEVHHGRLWVEANPDGGSIFIITLPIVMQ
jgi:two-component system sensor histidine kinase DctS